MTMAISSGMTMRDGYPAVAASIAQDPDQETFIFRKFSILTARTLLHLQSEILYLEQQLHYQDEKAAASADVDDRLHQRSHETMVRSAEAGHPGAQKQRDLLEKIRIKLTDYRKL